MPGVEIYTWYVYFGEFEINLNRKGGVYCKIIIKHGLPMFCDINAWVGPHALTMALSLAVASLMGFRQCMPSHALSFTKHRQHMFNYSCE